MATEDEVGVRLVVDGREQWSSNFKKASADVSEMTARVRAHSAELKTMGKELDTHGKAIENFGGTAKTAFSDAGTAFSNFIPPVRSGLSSLPSLAGTLAYPLLGVTAGLTAAAGAATYFG